MRYSFLILIFIGCAHTEVEPPPENLVEQKLGELEEGFTYLWKAEKKSDGNTLELNARGEYRGEGKYTIKGEIRINNTSREISNINPLQEIISLMGDSKFKPVRIEKDKIEYSFTANLTLFNPRGKEGSGKIIIEEGRITEITARSPDIEWEMEISVPPKGERKTIKIPDGMEPSTVKKRLEFYGEKRVEIKEDRVTFEEKIPVMEKTLLFSPVEISLKYIEHSPEGELLLAPDSIEHYRELDSVKVNITGIERSTDSKGKPLISLRFSGALQSKLTGLIINGELYSFSFPSGNILNLGLKKEKTAREIYAILWAEVKN